MLAGNRAAEQKGVETYDREVITDEETTDQRAGRSSGSGERGRGSEGARERRFDR